jgi:iron complex outermembrane receptor protein
VYWNAQDLPLENLDRVEVIRGPGATLWGANAVNGVINITTKSAKETQGGLVTTAFGTEDRPSATVRYGGQIAPNTYYRVFASYFSREGFVDHPGAAPADDWNMFHTGTRLDWEPTKTDNLTFDADYYRGTVREYFETTALTPPFVRPLYMVHNNFGGHALGRWGHQFSPSSALTVQMYYDRFHHGDGDTAETRDTFDFDLQHRFQAGTRHDVVWGFGYRYTADQLSPTFYLTFNPERAQEALPSFFAQDEITIVPQRVKFTVGSKIERNHSTGVEVQPSARLVWTPTPRESLWLAASRAVRTPARYDRDARLNSAASQGPSSPPFLVSLLSRQDVKAETLFAYEAGYRLEPTKRLSFEFASFYNVYRGILDYVADPVRFENEPAPAHLLLPLIFRNSLSGETYGTETSVQWRVTDRWKLTASHTWLHLRMSPNEATEAESPRHQFQLRSYLDLPHNLQLNAAAYYVRGTLTPLDNDTASINTYVRFDLGLSWRPTKSLEIGVWGQNLLDPRHPEYGSFKTQKLTEIPRSIVTKVTWRF